MKANSIKKMNEVWCNLMKMASLEPMDRKVISEHFDNMLEELANSDFFGTERQLDPRGDQRQ